MKGKVDVVADFLYLNSRFLICFRGRSDRGGQGAAQSILQQTHIDHQSLATQDLLFGNRMKKVDFLHELLQHIQLTLPHTRTLAFLTQLK